MDRTEILDRMDAMRAELSTLRGEVAFFTDHTYEVDLQRELRKTAEQQRDRIGKLCVSILDELVADSASPIAFRLGAERVRAEVLALTGGAP